MLDKFVANIVTAYLGKYIANLDKHHVKVSLWHGDVTLHDLEFRKDALRELKLPIHVKRGTIKQLKVVIPWVHIRSQSIRVEITDICLEAQPKRTAEYDPELEAEVAFEEKIEALETWEALRRGDEGEDEDEETDESAPHVGEDGAPTPPASGGATSISSRKESAKTSKKPKSSKSGSGATVNGGGDDEDATFVGRLKSTIVNNVQLSVQRVSILYEDADAGGPAAMGGRSDHVRGKFASQKGDEDDDDKNGAAKKNNRRKKSQGPTVAGAVDERHPVVLAFAFESFTAHSCDENWLPRFSSSINSMLYKSATLNGVTLAIAVGNGEDDDDDDESHGIGAEDGSAGGAAGAVVDSSHKMGNGAVERGEREEMRSALDGDDESGGAAATAGGAASLATSSSSPTTAARTYNYVKGWLSYIMPSRTAVGAASGGLEPAATPAAHDSGAMMPSGKDDSSLEGDGGEEDFRTAESGSEGGDGAQGQRHTTARDAGEGGEEGEKGHQGGNDGDGEMVSRNNHNNLDAAAGVPQKADNHRPPMAPTKKAAVPLAESLLAKNLPTVLAPITIRVCATHAPPAYHASFPHLPKWSVFADLDPIRARLSRRQMDALWAALHYIRHADEIEAVRRFRPKIITATDPAAAVGTAGTALSPIMVNPRRWWKYAIDAVRYLVREKLKSKRFDWDTFQRNRAMEKEYMELHKRRQNVPWLMMPTPEEARRITVIERALPIESLMKARLLAYRRLALERKRYVAQQEFLERQAWRRQQRQTVAGAGSIGLPNSATTTTPKVPNGGVGLGSPPAVETDYASATTTGQRSEPHQLSPSPRAGRRATGWWGTVVNMVGVRNIMGGWSGATAEASRQHSSALVGSGGGGGGGDMSRSPSVTSDDVGDDAMALDPPPPQRSADETLTEHREAAGAAAKRPALVQEGGGHADDAAAAVRGAKTDLYAAAMAEDDREEEAEMERLWGLIDADKWTDEQRRVLDKLFQDTAVASPLQTNATAGGGGSGPSAAPSAVPPAAASSSPPSHGNSASWSRLQLTADASLPYIQVSLVGNDGLAFTKLELALCSATLTVHEGTGAPWSCQASVSQFAVVGAFRVSERHLRAAAGAMRGRGSSAPAEGTADTSLLLLPPSDGFGGYVVQERWLIRSCEATDNTSNGGGDGSGTAGTQPRQARTSAAREGCSDDDEAAATSFVDNESITTWVAADGTNRQTQPSAVRPPAAHAPRDEVGLTIIDPATMWRNRKTDSNSGGGVAAWSPHVKHEINGDHDDRVVMSERGDGNDGDAFSSLSTPHLAVRYSRKDPHKFTDVVYSLLAEVQPFSLELNVEWLTQLTQFWGFNSELRVDVNSAKRDTTTSTVNSPTTTTTLSQQATTTSFNSAAAATVTPELIAACIMHHERNLITEVSVTVLGLTVSIPDVDSSATHLKFPFISVCNDVEAEVSAAKRLRGTQASAVTSNLDLGDWYKTFAVSLSAFSACASWVPIVDLRPTLPGAASLRRGAVRARRGDVPRSGGDEGAPLSHPTRQRRVTRSLILPFDAVIDASSIVVPKRTDIPALRIRAQAAQSVNIEFDLRAFSVLFASISRVADFANAITGRDQARATAGNAVHVVANSPEVDEWEVSDVFDSYHDAKGHSASGPWESLRRASTIPGSVGGPATTTITNTAVNDSQPSSMRTKAPTKTAHPLTAVPFTKKYVQFRYGSLVVFHPSRPTTPQTAFKLVPREYFVVCEAVRTRKSASNGCCYVAVLLPQGGTDHEPRFRDLASSVSLLRATAGIDPLSTPSSVQLGRAVAAACTELRTQFNAILVQQQHNDTAAASRPHRSASANSNRSEDRLSDRSSNASVSTAAAAVAAPRNPTVQAALEVDAMARVIERSERGGGGDGISSGWGGPTIGIYIDDDDDDGHESDHRGENENAIVASPLLATESAGGPRERGRERRGRSSHHPSAERQGSDFLRSDAKKAVGNPPPSLLPSSIGATVTLNGQPARYVDDLCSKLWDAFRVVEACLLNCPCRCICFRVPNEAAVHRLCSLMDRASHEPPPPSLPLPQEASAAAEATTDKEKQPLSSFDSSKVTVGSTSKTDLSAVVAGSSSTSWLDRRLFELEVAAQSIEIRILEDEDETVFQELLRQDAEEEEEANAADVAVLEPSGGRGNNAKRAALSLFPSSSSAAEWGDPSSRRRHLGHQDDDRGVFTSSSAGRAGGLFGRGGRQRGGANNRDGSASSATTLPELKYVVHLALAGAASVNYYVTPLGLGLVVSAKEMLLRHGPKNELIVPQASSASSMMMSPLLHIGPPAATSHGNRPLSTPTDTGGGGARIRYVMRAATDTPTLVIEAQDAPLQATLNSALASAVDAIWDVINVASMKRFACEVVSCQKWRPIQQLSEVPRLFDDVGINGAGEGPQKGHSSSTSATEAAPRSSAPATSLGPFTDASKALAAIFDDCKEFFAVDVVASSTVHIAALYEEQERYDRVDAFVSSATSALRRRLFQPVPSSNVDSVGDVGAGPATAEGDDPDEEVVARRVRQGGGDESATLPQSMMGADADDAVVGNHRRGAMESESAVSYSSSHSADSDAEEDPDCDDEQPLRRGVGQGKPNAAPLKAASSLFSTSTSHQPPPRQQRGFLDLDVPVQFPVMRISGRCLKLHYGTTIKGNSTALDLLEPQLSLAEALVDGALQAAVETTTKPPPTSVTPTSATPMSASGATVAPTWANVEARRRLISDLANHHVHDVPILQPLLDAPSFQPGRPASRPPTTSGNWRKGTTAGDDHNTNHDGGDGDDDGDDDSAALPKLHFRYTVHYPRKTTPIEVWMREQNETDFRFVHFIELSGASLSCLYRQTYINAIIEQFSAGTMRRFGLLVSRPIVTVDQGPARWPPIPAIIYAAASAPTTTKTNNPAATSSSSNGGVLPTTDPVATPEPESPRDGSTVPSPQQLLAAAGPNGKRWATSMSPPMIPPAYQHGLVNTNIVLRNVLANLAIKHHERPVLLAKIPLLKIRTQLSLRANSQSASGTAVVIRQSGNAAAPPLQRKQSFTNVKEQMLIGCDPCVNLIISLPDGLLYALQDEQARQQQERRQTTVAAEEEEGTSENRWKGERAGDPAAHRSGYPHRRGRHDSD